MAKGNTDLDDREVRAAQSMRAVYGADWMVVPRDVKGAAPGTHDFDLTDGLTTVAVEVSTIADGAVVGDSAGWSQHFPDAAWNIDGLDQGWVITVQASGNARKTKQLLGAWLTDLESRNEHAVWSDSWQQHAFTPQGHCPPGFATLHGMASVGVTSAHVEASLPAGVCTLLIVDDGFTWSPSDDDYISDFVSEQLAGPHASDVEKVGRATADRRAVFLWLHAQSHFDVVRRLDNDLFGGTLTGTGPLDEVWIGRHFVDESVSLWVWRASGGWAQFHLAATDLVDIGAASEGHYRDPGGDANGVPDGEVQPP
ncbi:hypothetical protein [Microbacterium sp. 2MCAF23]|uniref:hypothetical protein n=1 Tax=Microbacterium sp. 2MCAF23 TaxID=3232985 RepID=UPI003F9AFB0C